MGAGVLVESSKRVGPWREAIRHAAALAAEERRWVTMPDQPVMLALTFTLARPRSHYGTGRNADVLKPSAPGYPIGTPDLDKLCRATLDALTDSGVIHDDARVIALGATKTYPGGHADALDVPGAVVTLWQGEGP
jgi:crossover junction endodeoxyribonuclease RusA